MSTKKESLLSKLFAPLVEYNKKTASKQWKKSKVKCLDCGNTWNCIYPNVKGGETKLECPKCKHRNSMIIDK